MKELYMEYERSFDLIAELSSLLSSDEKHNSALLRTLDLLNLELVQCMHRNDSKAPKLVIDYIGTAIELFQERERDVDNSEIQRRLSLRIRRCLHHLRELNETSDAVLNSTEYYEEIIQKSKDQIASLSQEIDALKEDNKAKALKEDELKKLYIELEEYKKKDEAVKSRENIVANWKSKIQDSFEELDNHIKPIRNERTRLNWMYGVYSALSIAIVAYLVVVEIIISCKLCSHYGIPDFKEYLVLVVPVPIAVGLLIGFITQINRAQRQLVVLSKFIHDIKYTEGILQAINELATNVTDSSQRINEALDKLLDKHLSGNLDYIGEHSLKNEEKKDSFPYDSVISILKELKSKA